MKFLFVANQINWKILGIYDTLILISSNIEIENLNLVQQIHRQYIFILFNKIC